MGTMDVSDSVSTRIIQFIITFFRTSVMIPIREKNFFVCVEAKDSRSLKGTVMIYIRGTYQSQNFPIF